MAGRNWNTKSAWYLIEIIMNGLRSVEGFLDRFIRFVMQNKIDRGILGYES